MDLTHGNTGVYQYAVHLVFVPKYRHPIFKYKPLKDFTEAVLLDIAKQLNVEVHTILVGGEDDAHVHLFCDTNPCYNVRQHLQKFKGQSANRIFKAFPWLRGRDESNILGKGTNQKLFTKGHFWSRGKFGRSVGNVTADTIDHYIKRSKSIEQLNRQKTLRKLYARKKFTTQKPLGDFCAG